MPNNYKFDASNYENQDAIEGAWALLKHKVSPEKFNAYGDEDKKRIFEHYYNEYLLSLSNIQIALKDFKDTIKRLFNELNIKITEIELFNYELRYDNLVKKFSDGTQAFIQALKDFLDGKIG